MIRFTDYARISNNYCICYFGYTNEYVVQLRLLQPIIERELEGLNIYIGCRDECVHLLSSCKNFVKVSEIKQRKRDFAHIREIQFNGVDHPIEALMKESQIDNYAVPISPAERTQKCVICSKSFHPTKPLLKKQIILLKNMAKDEGYDPVVDADIENAGLVMGVECQNLFEAAARGIETRLVPTGLGTRLYKTMFQNGKVLKLAV